MEYRAIYGHGGRRGAVPSFMAVVWMILLYPQVHAYTLAQRREINEYFYETFFRKKQPLIQSQDHLVIYRGLEGPGLL